MTVKKLFVMCICVLCILLCACANTNEGDTGLSGDTSAGVSINVDGTNNTDTKVEGEDSILPYEKYGNKVYFAFEEKETNYYASVTNAKTNEDSGEITEEQYEVIVAPTDIPNDGKNYFKFIETYDELTTYISSPNVDASVFEDNYIICIKENFYLSNGWEKWFKILGYSNFKFTDNEYEISRNCYFSAYFGVHLDILAPVTLVNYLIIPKTEIDFIDGVQEISVNNNQINGDNGLWTDEFLGGNSKPMPPSTNTHACLTHDKKAVLPSESTAWVIEKESELERLLGLEPSDYSDSEFRVILYLPTEPKYDFIITKKEIKSGNLYLTIEEYSQYTNDYLKENDVNFYDLYIEDSSELADNFDVYVLVKIAGGERPPNEIEQEGLFGSWMQP